MLILYLLLTLRTFDTVRWGEIPEGQGEFENLMFKTIIKILINKKT